MRGASKNFPKSSAAADVSQVGQDGPAFREDISSDEHLSPELVERFARGELQGSLSQVHVHLDVCESCFEAVSLAAQVLSAPRDAAQGVSAPTRVGPYAIQRVLGRGGMGVVYAARHESKGHAVALKMVGVPSAPALGAIRQEISVLRETRHPGIVRILEADTTSGEPWYAMELLEGETLDDRFTSAFGLRSRALLQRSMAGSELHSDVVLREDGQPLPAPEEPPVRELHAAGGGRLEELLAVIVKLCEPLSFLHAAGVVHGDLKPTNIFLRQGAQPVLVDFGLIALTRGLDGRERLHVRASVAGTAPYLAPEVIAGQVPDARADLYALGCVLYEAVTGHPPFRGATAGAVLDQHLHAQWQPASSCVAHVPPALDALLAGLLVKDPRERIGHAHDVALALTALLPSPMAIQSYGSAYLFRPPMVGRTEELEQLTQLYRTALEGRGACALIAGESGIGKSFLTTEVCKHAVKHGLRVLTNECRPLMAAGPHAVDQPQVLSAEPLSAFSRVLESVYDHCREHGREETRRVLGDNLRLFADYAPSLLALDEAAHAPEPLPLPAYAARDRLLAAAAQLLRAFAATQPLLIAIDDLQWADDLSLAVLGGLDQTFFDTTPIAIIATYRDDDDPGADIRRLLSRPWVTGMWLPRLRREHVATLVSGMLSLESAPPDLLSFVEEHAEGVPFFAAEYLRAIAGAGLLTRDKGRWQLGIGERDPAAALEAVAFPKQVAELVRRRLLGLSSDLLAVLELGSVLGRTFDDDVLARAIGLPARALRLALGELMARQLLAASVDGGYRFLHDKIREVVYADLPSERRRGLHGHAMRAIEAAYSSGASAEEHYHELAHHARGARDITSALHYLEKSAERSLRLSAVGAAAASLRETLRLADTLPTPPTAVRRARWERMLGDALQGLGSVMESEEPLTRAGLLLGHAFPERDWQLSGVLLREVGKQAIRRLGLHRVQSGAQDDAGVELARVLERLQRVYYFRGRDLPLLTANITALNASDVPTPELAMSYGFAAALADIMLRARKLALHYFELADHTLAQCPDATVASNLAMIRAHFYIGHGRFELATRSAETAIAIARKSGYYRRLAESVATLIGLTLVRGHHGAMQPLLREQAELTARNEDVQMVCWSLFQRTLASCLVGDIASAALTLDQAVGHEGTLSRSDRIWFHGLRAYVDHVEGRYDRSGEHLALSATLIAQGPPVHCGLVDVYGKLAEIALARYAQARGPRRSGLVARARGVFSRARDERKRALAACRVVVVATKNFPLMRPLRQLHLGTLCWLDGDVKRAHALWQEGIA
ncbi:MAG: AAA family ATPase, partial [Polyangiales bacterium]